MQEHIDAALGRYAQFDDDCPAQLAEAIRDALLARAFEVLATEVAPAATGAKCCAVLGRAAGASALVGGQADDLAMAGRTDGEFDDDLTELEAIHRRKTGALIVAALELGGIVADGT